MTNTFIPYDLHIEDITSNSVLVEWDVHNSAEFKVGTYYNVYVKTNESSPEIEEYTSNTTAISLELKPQNMWVAVSSVVGGEESPLSPYIEIEAKIGVTDSADYSTIAVDKEGRPSKVAVTNNGEIIVSGISPEGSVQLATEETLTSLQSDVQNTNSILSSQVVPEIVSIDTKISTLNLNILDFASQNNTDLTAIKSTIDNFSSSNSSNLDSLRASVVSLNSDLSTFNNDFNSEISEIKSKLDALEVDLERAILPIIRESGEINGAGPGGVFLYLPWEIKSEINQVTVIKEGGSCLDYTVEIYNKKFSTSNRDMVIQAKLSESYSSDRLDFIHQVPYINMDGNPEIIIRIIPDNGTSNSFYVVLNGKKAN